MLLKSNNEDVKPEISKVVKKEIIDEDDGTNLSEDVLGQSLNEKDLSGGEDGGGSGQTQEVESPLETAVPAPGTKVPPIIINHAECGHLTFGDEKKNSGRPRDVGLYGGDSQKQ